MPSPESKVKRTKLELNHLQLIKDLESRLEFIDAELSVRDPPELNFNYKHFHHSVSKECERKWNCEIFYLRKLKYGALALAVKLNAPIIWILETSVTCVIFLYLILMHSQ